MINQFKNLNPVNLFLLFIYTLFMHLGIFLQLPETLHFSFFEPFAKLLIDIPLENAISPATNVFIAAIIVYVQALLFNRLVNAHNLVNKPTFLPALLFITGSSLFKTFLILSPPLICNFLIIWMIGKFLDIYKTGEAKSLLFDMGMIIALGTVMYFPFVMMLLMLWLSLIIYRPFNWREWVSGAVGFLTIFFFLWVLYFWNDNLVNFYKIWLPLSSGFPRDIKININDYLPLVPVVVIIVLGVFQLRENFFRSYIQIRKAYQLLFFMFVIAALSFYLKPGFRLSHFLLCVPTGSVLMAYYFSNATKRWFYELLFAVLVVSIQYFMFL